MFDASSSDTSFVFGYSYSQGGVKRFDKALDIVRRIASLPVTLFVFCGASCSSSTIKNH